MDVTTETFEHDVVERSRELPVVVDFYGLVRPCRTLGPAIESEVEKRMGKLELVKIDIDTEQALAARFGIQSIPTVAVFRDGEPVTGFAAPTRRRPSASSSMSCSPRRQGRQLQHCSRQEICLARTSHASGSSGRARQPAGPPELRVPGVRMERVPTVWFDRDQEIRRAGGAFVHQPADRPLLRRALRLASTMTRGAATTPSETSPSTRAWWPSATSAALSRRLPARRRTCAASLPRKPSIPAAERPWMGEVFGVDQASDGLVEGDAGGDEDGEDDGKAGQPLGALAPEQEGDPDRDSGEGASPRLWIRSASSATELVRTKTVAWTSAVRPRSPKLSATARRPARDRRTEGRRGRAHGRRRARRERARASTHDPGGLGTTRWRGRGGRWAVVDRLVEQDADMRVVQCVDDASAAPFAGHEAEVAEAQLVRDGRSFHRDTASAPTEQGDSRSRPRMRTRLGVASACIVSATCCAVGASSGAEPVRPCTPWLIQEGIDPHLFTCSLEHR